MDVAIHNEPISYEACHQYICDHTENPEIKIVTAKVEKGKISFENVKIKIPEELLPFPFRK